MTNHLSFEEKQRIAKEKLEAFKQFLSDNNIQIDLYFDNEDDPGAYIYISTGFSDGSRINILSDFTEDDETSENYKSLTITGSYGEQ